MRKFAYLIAFFALVLFFYCSAIAGGTSPLKVTFIDVGHGDCILIQTPDDGIRDNGSYEGKIILIDGGEKREGRRVIIPYLESHGIGEDKPIDFLVMTHADADHVGGLIPVIQAYQIKAILDPGFRKSSPTYRSFTAAARREPGCRFYKPLVGTLIRGEGDSLAWGSELQVKVLSSDKNARNVNDSSIVIWLKYGDVSFLLPGDAGGKERRDPPTALKYVEKDLVEQYGDGLRSTFLKASHHGSESASTNAFINKVSPRYTIICAGNKRFSGTLLPDESVLQRYRARGIDIYRTDRDDQGRPPTETSGDDHIVITTDGTLRGTQIRYE